MVAMGTSLADGAWGRESAVYRITGVLTVVGGWFFTAFSAFLASFLIASLIFFGKFPVILILIALSIFILLRTHAFHKRRAEKQERLASELLSTASNEVLKSCDDEVKRTIKKVSGILNMTYTYLLKEKHKELKKLRKDAKSFSKEIKDIRESIPDTLRKFEEHELESGHHYVQVVAYMKEMSNSLMHVVQPAYNHLDNNHPADKDQIDTVKSFSEKSSEYFDFLIKILEDREFNRMDELVKRRDEMINMANEILVSRIKILKKTQKGVKISVTYMEMLSENKNLFLNSVYLVKAESLLHESMGRNGINIEQNLMD
jgi:Na+/phosphate symporter